MLSKPEILFHENKIFLIKYNADSQFSILMSHPEHHYWEKVSQDTYQFHSKNNNQSVDHAYQIVCVLQTDCNNQVLSKTENVIRTIYQEQKQKPCKSETNKKILASISFGNYVIHQQARENSANLSNQKNLQKLKLNPQNQKTFYISKYCLQLKKISQNNRRSPLDSLIEQVGPEDMTFIMEKMKRYGQFKRMCPTAGSLALTFPTNLEKMQLQSCFILNEKKMNSKKIIQKTKLQYFVITETLPIFRKRQKIMELPKIYDFKQIILHNGWIILRAKTLVLFIKNKSPFKEMFNVQIQGITSLMNYFSDKIVLTKYKYLHIYNLKEDCQKCTKVAQVKVKGLQVYCYSSYGKHCLLAGRNHQAFLIGQDRVAQSRAVYFFKNFSEYNLTKDKVIVPDSKILVCESIKSDLPIQMIQGVPELQIFVCYFNKSVFVVHMDGQTGILAQVVLDSHYKLIKPVPYNFNLINFIGVTWANIKNRESIETITNNQHRYGNLLRVGIDSYMGKYGIQLKSYSSLPHAKNVSISLLQNCGKVYILPEDGQFIAQCNILTEKITEKVVQVVQGTNITMMASQQNNIVYLVDCKHYFDFYHIKVLS